jgi:hypothetical protein
MRILLRKPRVGRREISLDELKRHREELARELEER